MIPMMMIWRAGMRTMRKARRKKVGSILLCDCLCDDNDGYVLGRYCIVLS